MATKIPTQHADVKRGEIFLLHPADIAVDHGRNARSSDHTDEAVASLVESIRTHGQLQPVVIRRRHDGSAELVAGYGRHAAATVLVAEDPQFRLACRLVTYNEEDAFRLSIVENLERRDTSPIDDAVAQEKLRTVYGWDEAAIAKLYCKSTSYIARLSRLLTLPRDIQARVHAREIGVQAAIDLTSLPPDEAREVVESQPEDIGEVVRERRRESGVNLKRNLKELRNLLSAVADLPWVEVLTQYLDGQIATPEAEALLREAK